MFVAEFTAVIKEIDPLTHVTLERSRPWMTLFRLLAAVRNLVTA